MKWLDNAAIARSNASASSSAPRSAARRPRRGHWRDRANQDGAGCGLARVHRDFERKLGPVLPQAAHGAAGGVGLRVNRLRGLGQESLEYRGRAGYQQVDARAGAARRA